MPPPASPLGQQSSPKPSPGLKTSLNRPTHSPSASTSSAASAAAAVRRRPTLNNGSPKSPTLGGPSVDDMERERAKTAGLKALVSAAEEREADALKEANLWRSKADEAATELARMEQALGAAQEDKTKLERAYKELDKAKALAKEHERRQLDQADEFEATRAAWADEEANLRARLSAANAKLAEFESAATASSPDVESPPVSADTPAVVPAPPAAEKQATSLLAALEQLANEKAAAVAELQRTTIVAEALRAQMLDLERMNEQLMDDNESYQLLVGERTLMGGFDVKQLMRSEEEEASGGPRPAGGRRSPPSTSSAPSLAGVEEEDEEEDEEEADEVERAVLEAHGNGSRTTGAVDAEVARPPKRAAKRTKDAGLDLAAELAQAEETEVDESRRKKEAAERKKAKNTAKDREQEIKALQDANKALVLYISKILDRISAHEGFERVLSSDYSPSRGRSQTMAATTAAATATTTAATAVANAAGTLYSALIKPAPTVELKPLNLPTGATVASAASSASATAAAAKRGSWMDFFTSARSPPANQARIKPLRLGTAGSVTGAGSFSAGLSGGWSGVNLDNELGEEDEDSEEGRARERRLAEMKLHGISDGAEGEDKERTVRAMRRSSSVHGVSGSRSQSKVLDERRRMSVEQYGQQQQTYPGALTGSPPMTPAEMMKRVEEREKESKKNLEKGQASGFTEIEIRGHRMRPSAGRMSSGSGTESPGGVKSPGIRDLKMTTADGKNNSNDAEAEGLLARTARRISMMSGGK